MQKAIATENAWTAKRTNPKFSLREHLRQRRLERDIPLEFQERSESNELLIPWAIAIQRTLGS
jgi:hypothetical protein